MVSKKFNEIHGFNLDEEQSKPLPSEDKQSFVPDIPEQIQMPVQNHVSDVLIDHHANQQIEWNQTIHHPRCQEVQGRTWKALC